MSFQLVWRSTKESKETKNNQFKGLLQHKISYCNHLTTIFSLEIQKLQFRVKTGKCVNEIPTELEIRYIQRHLITKQKTRIPSLHSAVQKLYQLVAQVKKTSGLRHRQKRVTQYFSFRQFRKHKKVFGLFRNAAPSTGQ